MTMRSGPALGLTLLSLTVLACDGGGALSDPGSQVQFAFTATSSDPALAAVRSDDSAVNVKRAWISLSVLELVPCSADAAPIAMVDEYRLDLARHPPSQAALESLVTEYCRLRLRVEASRGSVPEAIAELAVHIEGIRADGVPFSIESALERTFELARSPARAFDGLHFAVGVDLARWFDGVELDEAGVNDGVAVVSDASNSTILAAFEANTAASVALYVDADRDGVLDADELAPIAEAR